MHAEGGCGASQKEAIDALLGKLGAPVHEIIESILVPVVVICQQRLIPFLQHKHGQRQVL